MDQKIEYTLFWQKIQNYIKTATYLKIVLFAEKKQKKINIKLKSKYNGIKDA